MDKKHMVSFFLLNILCSLAFAALPAEKQDLQLINLVQNPGFENGKARYASSGGTVAIVTSGSNSIDKSSMTFDASSSGQYVETALYTIPVALQGNDCYAKVDYLGGDENLTMKVIDGSAVEIATKVFVASTKKEKQFVNFTCPSSGTLKLRVVSTANAAIIALDRFHLGDPENIIQVSQAVHLGTLKYATAASCSWEVTNAAYTSFPVDADCSAPSVTGSLTAPGTKIPGFVLTVQAGGVYRITAKSMFNSLGGFSSFRFSDGTDSSELSGGPFGSVGTVEGYSGIISAIYKPTTGGSKTIEIQAKNPASTARVILTTADLVFEVEKIPSQTELVASSLDGNLDWAAYTPTITGFTSPTNVSFTWSKKGSILSVKGTFTPDATEAVLASITLPNSYQIDGVKISLNNTTANPGIPVGIWLNSAIQQDGKLVAAPATNANLIYFGTSSGGSGQYNIPQNGNGILTTGGAVTVEFEVPISGWKEPVLNMPVVINGGVSSGYAGVLRVESARISDAGVVSQETSNWINGNCTPNGGAGSSCTLNSGLFSSAHCWCDSKNGAYWMCYNTGLSALTLTYTTGNHTANAAAEVTMYCMGPN